MSATVKLAQRLNPADRVQFLSLIVKATVVDTLSSVDPELRREVLRNVAETYLAEDDAKREDDAAEAEPRLKLASPKRLPPAIGAKQGDRRCQWGDERVTARMYETLPAASRPRPAAPRPRRSRAARRRPSRRPVLRTAGAGDTLVRHYLRWLSCVIATASRWQVTLGPAGRPPTASRITLIFAHRSRRVEPGAPAYACPTR
jgi:hypothetical protein